MIRRTLFLPPVKHSTWCHFPSSTVFYCDEYADYDRKTRIEGIEMSNGMRSLGSSDNARATGGHGKVQGQRGLFPKRPRTIQTKIRAREALAQNPTG